MNQDNHSATPEELLTELQEIHQTLEGGQAKLNDLARLVKRASQIRELLEKELRQVENQIEEIEKAQSRDNSDL